MMFLSAQDMKLHKREMLVYEHFHPLLRDLANSVVGNIQLNAPDAYFWRLDETGAFGANTTLLVLQDLKESGFKMVNKKIGCTADEAQITLTALANYHALSAAFLAPYVIDGQVTGLPEVLQPIVETPSWFNNMYDLMAVNVNTYTDLLKKLNQPEVLLKSFK